ncbi:Dihydrofolate reductase-like domain containing protein [Amanita muscaria]
MPRQFLQSLFGRLSTPDTRPLVTLTFAQSLDAKIGGKDSQQLLLSGKESMLMTHWMRSLHDAILIGIGTALNDNPQLNTRLLLPQDQRHLPRPIILDSTLRLSPDCKLLTNYRAHKGRRPYIIAADTFLDDVNWKSRRATLEAAGARILTVPLQGDLLHFPSVLKSLRDLAITSLMIEGGARVISSLLTTHPDLIDIIVITVAPLLVGDQGVAYHGGLAPSQFKHVATHVMGTDSIVTLAAHNLLSI